MYFVTHPSLTSNVRPTAGIVSRYVDVVRVVQWVECRESYGRPLFEFAKCLDDHPELRNICAGNGALSVCGKM